MAKRKRGELPSCSELTEKMHLDGYVVVDVRHEERKVAMKDKPLKYLSVRLMNIETGEKTGWILRTNAAKKYGKEDSGKRVGKHTTKSIGERVEELTEGNAELLKWERRDTWIEVEVKYKKCGCVMTKLIQNGNPTPECPYCSPRWKTEAKACEIAERIAKGIKNRDVSIRTQRQFPAKLPLKNGELVERRYDCMVILEHKLDPSIRHWIAIEYHGEQHYMHVNWSGKMTEEEMEEKLRINQIHDMQKEQCCAYKNIPLIVIPYTQKDKIEEILERELPIHIMNEALMVDVRYWQPANQLKNQTS